MKDNDEFSFQQIIDDLLDFEKPFPARHLYRFSDIEPDNLQSLTSVWPQLPFWRRRGLLEDMKELSESDTLLSFMDVGLLAVRDEEPEVRLAAVNALKLYDDTTLAYLLIELINHDQDTLVRAAAASALGQFVYLGEIDSINDSVRKNVEECLLHSINKTSDPEILRRRVLESLGYSSHQDVPGYIEHAFQSENNEWKSSALLAMGRSADEQWFPTVLEMLDHTRPSIRFEAAKAAGELEIREAVDALVDLINDPNEEVRSASIWSLAQIGGEGIRELLEELLNETEEESDQEYIEAAIEILEFNEGIHLMPLLGLPDTQIDNTLEDPEFDFDDLEDTSF